MVGFSFTNKLDSAEIGSIALTERDARLKKMSEVGLIPPSPDVSKGLRFLVSSNNVALSKYLYSKPVKFVESLKVRSLRVPLPTAAPPLLHCLCSLPLVHLPACGLLCRPFVVRTPPPLPPPLISSAAATITTLLSCVVDESPLLRVFPPLLHYSSILPLPYTSRNM